MPLFLAALVPPAIAFPLRFFLSPDTSPLTLVLLGPALEEGLKLAAVVLALIVAGLFLPRGRDPANALRYWLFLAPWVVGGLYGLMEGLVVYPGESHLNFTMRELAHATFTALGLAAALWSWRLLGSRYVGMGLGFGAAWSAHILFNSIALLSEFTDIGFTDQALYALAALVVALVLLGKSVTPEPASRESRSFLLIRPSRLRT